MDEFGEIENFNGNKNIPNKMAKIDAKFATVSTKWVYYWLLMWIMHTVNYV